MVKYSSIIKAQIIGEHLDNNTSGAQLARKYQLPKRRVQEWIQNYHLGGIETVGRRRGKRQFSAEFKLGVIDYYQTHDESLADVAIKYHVLASQISTWRTTFLRDGFVGLKPHPKGRPAKMKSKKKQLKQLEKPSDISEIEHLRNELALKKQELYDTKLENDILKKSLTLFGPSKDGKKHK